MAEGAFIYPGAVSKIGRLPLGSVIGGRRVCLSFPRCSRCPEPVFGLPDRQIAAQRSDHSRRGLGHEHTDVREGGLPLLVRHLSSFLFADVKYGFGTERSDAFA